MAVPDSDAERIRASYRVRATPAEAAALARAVAYEQTVELPANLVRDPYVCEQVVARVEAVAADGAQHSRFTLSFSAELGALNLSALLNLVYGNVSIYPAVRLVELVLPDAVTARAAGGRLGVSGLRTRLGVHGRPLLATALKPNGSAIETLADMAGRFARGGGDIVKDDQNLIDDFERFKRRTLACRDAVAAANDARGGECLYFPHVAGPGGELRRRMEFAREIGLEGVLACPLIAGLDTVRSLCAELGLILMAHPAMSGTYTNGPDSGIAHGVLLGTLFRLAGADVSIFPNVGGRFAFTAEDCRGIVEALGAPLGTLAPAWPAPAGGMGFDSLAAMAAAYGEDAVLLIGGALLGHDADLERGTRAFVERIGALFPGASHTSARTPPAPALPDPRRRHLAFQPGFAWHDRPSSPYKDAADDSFRGVRRVELVGKHGERSNCDLRYFEVEPGGHSSREWHQHTHVIIGARGRGVLVMGNRRVTLAPMDVAYIEPLETHQLLNEGAEPFGFFCIVDHERDRPTRV